MLRLSNVSAGYGARNILEDINLSVNPQEIVAVIGLNGSGKSTLLRTMLGLLPPSKGEVLIDGKNIRTWRPHERAERISLLDSKIQMNFPTSVSELLDLGGLRRNTSDHKNLREDALRAVGLEKCLERNLLELSSGEAKRALIAHTLCSGAKVILLDEPLANLDWSHQADLVENLKSWQAKYATTFVLAVHELAWAVKIAHRICVLDQGRALFTGSTEETLLNPRVREVFAFQSRIDENSFDGSKELILGRSITESELHGFKK